MEGVCIVICVNVYECILVCEGKYKPMYVICAGICV